jgi:AraC-like DNA-binding protein
VGYKNFQYAQSVGQSYQQTANLEFVHQLPYLNNFERFLQFFKLMDIIRRSDNIVHLASNDYINLCFSSKNKRISTIHEYLMKNYREPIDLKQIASLVNMAEGSLCRFFKQQVRMTIFEYLNQIKIEFACNLLLDKNLSILDIAINSGFNNLSYFNKQFKRTTGLPPMEYRKRFKELS